MSTEITQKMLKFIPRLRFPDFNIPMADFKGHHAKALHRISQLAPQVDLVLEIRDARAPLSTRNVLFDRALHGIEKIILYSKKDSTAISTKLFDKWHQDESYMFIDCRRLKDANFLIEIAKSKYNKMHPPPPLGLRIMILGMPNVGKSTLVNSLRVVGLGPVDDRISGNKQNKKVAKTGGMPGVTRATSEIIRISKNPSLLLYDTPGISVPKVSSSEQMLALSLVGSISPTYIDPVIQADYLLYLMNLQEPLGKLYSEYLSVPTNNILKLLRAVSKKIGKHNIKTKFSNGKTFDETGSAIYWVDRWRQGKEGRIVFDTEAIGRYNDVLKRQVDYKELELKEKQRMNNMDIALNRDPNVDSKGKPRPKSYGQRRAEKQNALFPKRVTSF